MPHPRLDRRPGQTPDAGLPSLAPSPCPGPAFPGLSPLPPNRVFSDRLVDAADMEAFVGILSDKLGSFFDLTFHNLCPSKRSPIFGELALRPAVPGHGCGTGSGRRAGALVGRGSGGGWPLES